MMHPMILEALAKGVATGREVLRASGVMERFSRKLMVYIAEEFESYDGTDRHAIFTERSLIGVGVCHALIEASVSMAEALAISRKDFLAAVDKELDSRRRMR